MATSLKLIKSFYALNHYLLIAKYHTYLAENQSATPILKVFPALLDTKLSRPLSAFATSINAEIKLQA